MKLLVITGAPGPSLFQSHPAGTVTDKFQIQQTKTKTELFRLLLTVHPISAFETEKNPRFQTTAQNTVFMSVDKVLSSVFLSGFEIVSGENAAGESGYGDGEP